MTPSYSPVQNSVDAGHIKLLSIFHFVMAGLTALFACFPIIHVVLGVLMVSGKLAQTVPPTTGPTLPPVPSEIGYLFIVMGSVALLLGWTMAILMLIAGVKLGRHRSRTFCIVVGAVECLFIPFGTLLGVFTIIVLAKDSTKALFDGTLQPTLHRPA